MIPTPTSSLKAACIFWLLLLCAQIPLSLRAVPPPGKVIWWGMNPVDPCGPYRDKTNGVIESDEVIASNVTAIPADYNHGLALRSDGTVIGLGRAFGGIPVPAGLSNVESIAMTEDTCCWATKQDGTVVRWRDDTPHVVSELKDIIAVTMDGQRNYIALSKDGSVAGVCDASVTFDPATGAPSPPQGVRPVEVHGEILNNVAALASINGFPIMLKNDGTVLQIGGSPEDLPPFRYASAQPVIIDGTPLTNVVSIAGGGLHCLALKSNGTVVAWGEDAYSASHVPPGLSNVTAVAAAQDLSLALKRDGTVVAWGNNHWGQTSVPPGLSNVVQIAASGLFAMAITTGAVPASVFVTPHGRLEEMARKADLIFKGQAVSSERITNAAFTISRPAGMELSRTRFKIISVLQGEYTNPVIEFQHYSGWTPGGHSWGGAHEPAYYRFEPGQSYIVYAANLARKDQYSYYQPAPNTANKPTELREVADYPNQDDDGVIRALDARPVENGSIREVCWAELNLLLNDGQLTNQLYAIEHLDRMSKLCNAWGHSEDFKRPRVLKVLRPFLVGTNDKVAITAINGFAVGSECATQLVTYVPDLIRVADNSAYSTPRRVAAIAAFSGTGFPELTNSLPKWLSDPSEHVRAQAVLLLPNFPGQYSEVALRERAADPSPRVRARVADAIGNGKIESLVPTLETLLKDAVGLTTSPPPLSVEEYQSGLGPWGGSDANVHAAAGNALLKFEVEQVGGILKSNLNDLKFRPDYLCKLAEKDAGPWLPDLAKMMEGRRAELINEAKTNGFSPETYLYLSGTYFHCWEIIYNHLKKLPELDFSDHKLDHYLDLLENAGNTGSREPVMLYELYRTKALSDRARKFRADMEKKFASYNIAGLFNQADARLTNSPPK